MAAGFSISRPRGVRLRHPRPFPDLLPPEETTTKKAEVPSRTRHLSRTAGRTDTRYSPREGLQLIRIGVDSNMVHIIT